MSAQRCKEIICLEALQAELNALRRLSDTGEMSDPDRAELAELSDKCRGALNPIKMRYFPPPATMHEDNGA